MKNIAFFKALLLEEIDEKKLSDKQKKIAKLDPPADELDAGDFKKLRSMKEEELKLGIKYDIKGASDSGFISTGGSPDPKNWKFLADKGTYPYLSVKKKLVPSSEQPTKYGKAFGYGLDNDTYTESIDENEDHEVSMAHNSLKSIVSSASQLMNLLGSDEKDIPAWIQDHITNAENYINQAAKNYHDYSHEQEPEQDAMSLQSMMEDLLEAKKKPSAGLTKKQKSNIVKKAKAGKDMGKKGKGFEKIVKAAEKSGADNPQAVAGAAFWKGQAKKAK